MKYFKCESKKLTDGNLTIIVACLQWNKPIKSHLCGVAFVFMVNSNMQFIGEVYELWSLINIYVHLRAAYITNCPGWSVALM